MKNCTFYFSHVFKDKKKRFDRQNNKLNFTAQIFAHCVIIILSIYFEHNIGLCDCASKREVRPCIFSLLLASNPPVYQRRLVAYCSQWRECSVIR